MNKIEVSVNTYINAHEMLKKGEKVVVALSGGADSVSLLLIMATLGYECHAAHCNFHLRGEESMRDERFVEALCQRMDIPLHKTDFDTETYAKTHGQSIEMAARELRYAFFRNIMEETGAKAIAVGHHKNDNAETMLLNIVRGTGIRGVCAIQPINGNIIRPLLCLRHEDILEYLKDKKQDYITDSTNLEDIYSRNKIRLNVLPLLQSINTAAVDNIISTIDNLNEVRKVYEAAIAADLKRCMTTRYNNVAHNKLAYIDIEELQKSPSPASILHEAITPMAFNASQEADIMQALARQESGALFYSPTHVLTIDRHEIVIADINAVQLTAVPLEQFKAIEKKEVNTEALTINKDKAYAYLDKSKVKGRLTVRPCQQGDAFTPFGMKGRKLVSDYMTDKKYNRIEKMTQLVVCDESGDIVWLVGERSSERHRIDQGSKTAIVLKAELA